MKFLLSALAAILLSGCGLVEPDGHPTWIDRVDVPSSLSPTEDGAVSLHYSMTACEELVGLRTNRAVDRMTVAVLARERRGIICTGNMAADSLQVHIASPVTTPFRLTIRRRQGDTTYTMPVE